MEDSILNQHKNIREYLVSGDSQVSSPEDLKLLYPGLSVNQIGELKEFYKILKESNYKFASNYKPEKNVISISQFDNQSIGRYVDLALKLKNRIGEDLFRSKIGNLLKGYIVMNIFLQYSTRTHNSFESAEKMLGANVINEKDPELKSFMSRGESFADSIRTVYNYADAFVLRTPWDYSTEEAVLSQNCFKDNKPFINGGSGRVSHPTQGLLDYMTIKENFPDSKNLKISIVGSKYKRSLASFIEIIIKMIPGLEITIINPPDIVVSDTIKSLLDQDGVKCNFCDNLYEGIQDADVIYLACIEKLSNPENEKDYSITKKIVLDLKKKPIILHPLPKKDEIEYSLHSDPACCLWEEAHNGVFIRAIMLLLVLGKLDDLEKIFQTL